MLPPLQWVMTSSWPSSPVKRYDGDELTFFALIHFKKLLFLSTQVFCKFWLWRVSLPCCTDANLKWFSPLFYRTWMLKTKMRTPWTSWKVRRSCLAVSVRGITGPLAVRTRTRLVQCRRNWLSSWVCPRVKKRRQQVWQLHVILSIFWKSIIHFVFNKNIFILISRARACPASPKQDWEVCSPQLAGRWYAQRRVHAA